MALEPRFVLAGGGATALAVVSLLAACNVRRPGGIVGASHGDAADSASSVGHVADDAGNPGPPSPIPDPRGWAKVNAARFVSMGHATGRFEADVYGDDAGVRALVSASAALPAAVGARLIMDHVERAGPEQGRAQARMMMEKRPPGFDAAHGDWRYVVVNAAGAVMADGPVESCAGCHDDAPRDHLFPVGSSVVGP